MKTVKQLYHHLNSTTEFKLRYPNYDPSDKKIHVLYLSACTNESGYYRMILPALELNRTSTHAAIIAHIHKWDFNKQFDDYDTPIDFRLVQWADYIVMPTLFTDVSYIIDSIREINSDVEFVMDIDLNYYTLPEDHPEYRRIGTLKDGLFHNLNKIDILTAPNEDILNTYFQLLEEQSDEVSVYFEPYENLLSHFTFEEARRIHRNSGETVRIGILTEGIQVSDVRILEPILQELKEKHKGIIEIIVVGWSAKIGEQNNIFQSTSVHYEKPVPFQEYYNKLYELGLDIGLLPLVNNSYNSTGKAFNRYLDFCSCMVPVIASRIPPFETVVEEGETGFLAADNKEWLEKIEVLIEKQLLRHSVGEHAFKMAWENFSYTPKTLQRLQNLFI